MASRTSLTPRAALIVGLFCAGCGIALILATLSGIGPQPTPGTPVWVAVSVEAMFVLAGAALINGYAIGRVDASGDFAADTPFAIQAIQYLLGLAIVGLMAAVSGWIAFGRGPRQFSTTIALPFFATRTMGGSLAGRIAFGAGTIMLVAMFAGLGWSGARLLQRIWQARRSEPPAV